MQMEDLSSPARCGWMRSASPTRRSLRLLVALQLFELLKVGRAFDDPSVSCLRATLAIY